MVSLKEHSLSEQQIEINNEIQEEIQQNIKEHTQKAINELTKEKYIYVCKSTTPFYFVERLGLDTCIKIFNHMEECKCCERHQINKPTQTLFMEGYTPFYDDYSYNHEEETYYNEQKKKDNEHLKKCNCSCRHICRLLCREVNDQEEY
jgi:hypothetical protein